MEIFTIPASLSLVQLLVVSLTIESLVENILWLIEGKWSKETLTAFVVAIVVACLAQVDLYHYAGINLAVPIVAYVLSGVMLARGANIIHDMSKLLSGGKTEPPQLLG